jgi:hypothetical protein
MSEELVPEAEIDPVIEEEVCSVSFEIGDLEGEQILVTFTDGTITHERHVNACFTDNSYDADATSERCKQVARGVARKIELGLISQN